MTSMADEAYQGDNPAKVETTSAFASIPDEIKLMIVQRACQREQMTLARVCRSWTEVSRLEIWQGLSFSYYEDDNDRLSSLSQLWQKAPGLPKYVKEVYIEGLEDSAVAAFVEILLLCRNLAALHVHSEESATTRLLFLLAETSSPFLGMVEMRVALGQSWEAEILWIFRLAPNLNLLAIDPQGASACSPSHSIRWPQMTHLSSLFVESGQNLGPILRHVISLAPNLRHLWFGGCDNWSPDQEVLDSLRSRDNIECIIGLRPFRDRRRFVNRLLERGFPLSDNLRSVSLCERVSRGGV